MNNIDFRVQSIVAPPTSTGIVKMYANPSGALMFVNSVGTTGNAAGLFGVNLSQAGGTITTGVLQPGTLGLGSGSYFGTTGAYGSKPVFLAGPDRWLTATGPSGELLVIPAYLRTT